MHRLHIPSFGTVICRDSLTGKSIRYRVRSGVKAWSDVIVIGHATGSESITAGPRHIHRHQSEGTLTCFAAELLSQSANLTAPIRALPAGVND
jgi:hypothetical protein